MKKIIVATDFSSAAFNAAVYGAHMAMAIDADLVLLHVYSMPLVYSEVPVTVSAEEIRTAAEANMTQLKQQLEKRLEGKLKIDMEIRMGSFFHELKIVCAHLRPYTVVMGSQGTSATERLLFGSHA